MANTELQPTYPGGPAQAGGGSSPLVAAATSPNRSASDIYAALTEEQWQNYVTTFIPIENQLIQYATDPNQVTLAMAAAHQNVEGSYATQKGALEREFSGMGVTLTPEQKTAQERQYGLSHALADVQAQNTARSLTLNRQQSILGNPAPTAAATAQQATMVGG